MNKLKPPETPREALKLALWLTISAPSHEKMIEAGKVAMQLIRTLPHEVVEEVMTEIEDSIEARERALFGMPIDDLKSH
jgi:hypothetical protein